MRYLSEDSNYKTLANVNYRVRQLERRPCQPCGAVAPLDTFRLVSGAGINATVISACPSVFYGHQLGNDHATLFRYVHLFDQATLPHSGQTPKLTFAIPWQSGANQEYDDGIEFPNGIALALSTDPSTLLPVEEQLVVANIAYLSTPCTTPLTFTGLQTDPNQLLIEGTESNFGPALPETPPTPPPPNFSGTEPQTGGATISKSNQLLIETPEAATGLPETPQ